MSDSLILKKKIVYLIIGINWMGYKYVGWYSKLDILLEKDLLFFGNFFERRGIFGLRV